MLEVADAILSKVLIRSVPGIDKCLLITPNKQGEKPFLMVQGINFDAFYSYSDIVNV